MGLTPRRSSPACAMGTLPLPLGKPYHHTLCYLKSKEDSEAEPQAPRTQKAGLAEVTVIHPKVEGVPHRWLLPSQ
jgi:hypothetical protein